MRSVLAVFAGGLVGTCTRLLVDAVAGDLIGTLIVNVVGSFVLGLLVSLVWPRVPDWARAGLGAGVLGSFTTFSALAVLLLGLELLPGAGYLALTLVLGLAAAFLGLRLGRSGRAPIDVVNE